MVGQCAKLSGFEKSVTSQKQAVDLPASLAEIQASTTRESPLTSAIGGDHTSVIGHHVDGYSHYEWGFRR